MCQLPSFDYKTIKVASPIIMQSHKVVGIVLHSYVWVHNRSNMPIFCLKKLISQPWVVQKSQFLEEMTLTHYILMSLIKKSNNKLIKLIK